jgi:FAD/FMN-containing dehydrogenase
MLTALNIDVLREQLRGDVIGPEDADYEKARGVFNAMIDRRPAVIVRPVNAYDVATAVNFARENQLSLAIRDGGHSVPGFGTVDDGLVIDLSHLRGVRIDPNTKTARVDGGATWGDFNHAGYGFGLATTGGIISTTGVSGLTLGGGIGYLTRKHGLSLDNVISADVVTADGKLLVASERENDDLFWAIRGGGGNFGVVTSWEFRVHPVKDIVGGPIFFEVSDTEKVLRFWRDFIKDAPRDFGGFPAFQIAPPLPFIPENRHGDTFVILVACWTGSPDDGEKILTQLRNVAPVVADGTGTMPYHALNSAFDALYPYGGLQHYWKSNFVKELSDDAIKVHVEHGSKVPVMTSTMHLYPIDGAVHDVDADATAFAYRDADTSMVIAGMWPDAADNEKNIQWVRDYAAAIEPYAEEGGYINFLSDDDQPRIKANFRGHYDRLVNIKRKYDPDNLFRNNQNIKP